MNTVNVVLMVVMVAFYYSYAAAEWKNNQKTYIVHMDKSVKPSMFSDHLQWYQTSMRSVSESTNMLYVYNTVIHGYSTRLTVDEAKLLEQKHGIISVQEETVYKIQTTHSPEFLGLKRNKVIFGGSRSGSDVIVVVVDTGVWPGSKSLDDTGFGPIPHSWKGECESGPGFSKAYEAT